MKTIDKIYSSKIEIKKSNFLSYLCPYKDFKVVLDNIKNEHPKAVHFVYAYRFLNELNQIVEDKSDDKEPKNTAGTPSLNVLRGLNLINTAVVIVRYFGGIKLGTGGLVRAYSSCVNAVVESACLIDFEPKEKIQFSLNVALYTKFEHFFKKHKFCFTSNFKSEKVFIELLLNDEEKEIFTDFSKEFKVD